MILDILGLPIRVAKLETSIQFQSWEKLWARDMFIVTYISILTTHVSIVLLVLIKSSKIFENTICFPKSWNNEISKKKVIGLSFGHSQHLQVIIPQETQPWTLLILGYMAFATLNVTVWKNTSFIQSNDSEANVVFIKKCKVNVKYSLLSKCFQK